MSSFHQMELEDELNSKNRKIKTLEMQIERNYEHHQKELRMKDEVIQKQTKIIENLIKRAEDAERFNEVFTGCVQTYLEDVDITAIMAEHNQMKLAELMKVNKTSIFRWCKRNKVSWQEVKTNADTKKRMVEHFLPAKKCQIVPNSL